MKYLKTFENHNSDKILFVVDVQKSFKDFFSEMYLHELKNYCREFNRVYQIFDNHVDGKNVDKDYLYDDDPEILIHDDLYFFPNQVEIIEKRYNYDVDVDFYKNILDKEVYNEIKEKEKNKTIKKGDLFKTKEETAIVYIGNNHKWFHVPKKLYEVFNNYKNKEVIITGGADSECLEDLVVSAESLGVKIKRNHKFIYSAAHCPI
jgi:hypothetical protein